MRSFQGIILMCTRAWREIFKSEFRAVGSFFMVRGAGLSENVGHHGWPRTKNKKKHWLKRPKAVPQKRNLDQNINDSKSHTCILGVNIISEHYQSFYILDFRFSSGKSQSQQKISEKDNLTYNTVSLKKPHSFYKPQLTRHWKMHAHKTQPKTFLTLQILQQTSGWCQKKHWHCKALWKQMSVYFCISPKENVVPET